MKEHVRRLLRDLLLLVFNKVPRNRKFTLSVKWSFFNYIWLSLVFIHFCQSSSAGWDDQTASSCCHFPHTTSFMSSPIFAFCQSLRHFPFVLMKQIAAIHHHLKNIVWISISCCYWRASDTSFQHLSIKTPLDLGSITATSSLTRVFVALTAH